MRESSAAVIWPNEFAEILGFSEISVDRRGTDKRAKGRRDFCL
jgi:hypothetical protein